jgi:hypothetical protein
LSQNAQGKQHGFEPEMGLSTGFDIWMLFVYLYMFINTLFIFIPAPVLTMGVLRALGAPGMRNRN